MISTSSLALCVRRAALALGAATLLGACGGGTSQVDPFRAQRVLAFGDETSTLTASGRKYSVNALATDQSIDCAVEPIWAQAVANLYGLVFAECNPNAVAEPGATMLAAAGAQAADLAAQVDAAEAGPGFAQRTLATVMMGANDVLAAYGEFPARSEADLVAELRSRGAVVAEQINRLIGRNVRVVLATVPDLGHSPFAEAEKAAHTDTDRAALLSRLTSAMNAGIRINIVNDGSNIGLVLADEMVQAMSASPGSFSLSSADTAACTVAPPDCTAATLIDGATSVRWLWSDDRHLAFGGQQRLGLLARSRAANNPF